MSDYINSTALVAATPLTQQKSSNWFEAMAQAWGQALDKQADLIQTKSDALQGGSDTPSALTELTTESLKMSFISNSAHTAISTGGEALQTMARKQ